MTREAGRGRQLLLIGAGGTLGALVRALLEEAVPPGPSGWPWATFGINVSGAFVLGVLLELLARTGVDTGWRRQLRLGVGTGFLGGYTTYSTFAVEVTQLSTGPAPALGPGYAVASVFLGAAAAASGYLIGARWVEHRAGRPGRRQRT